MKKLAQKKAHKRKLAVKKKVAARRVKIREEAKMKKLIGEMHKSAMESTFWSKDNDTSIRNESAENSTTVFYAED